MLLALILLSCSNFWPPCPEVRTLPFKSVLLPCLHNISCRFFNTLAISLGFISVKPRWILVSIIISAASSSVTFLIMHGTFSTFSFLAAS